MSPVLVATLCTASALVLAVRFTRPPVAVPFPRGPKPPQFPDVVSARVAAAQGMQRIAEEKREEAEKAAKRDRAEVKRLIQANAALKERAGEAEARVVALEDLKLPIAIEMVAKMGQAAADGEVAGGGDGEAGAATANKPKPPRGPRQV